MMNPLALFAFAALQALMPSALVAREAKPGWEETPEDVTDREEAIATDIADVAVRFPLGPGRTGLKRTVAYLVGIVVHEGQVARDVDEGPCYRAKEDGRCDHGKAVCLAQIEVGDGVTSEGWTRAELFADRTKCFTSAVHLVGRSLRACAKLPRELQLAQYAYGSCDGGHAAARDIDALVARVFKRPLPAGDTVVATWRTFE